MVTHQQRQWRRQLLAILFVKICFVTVSWGRKCNAECKYNFVCLQENSAGQLQQCVLRGNSVHCDITAGCGYSSTFLTTTRKTPMSDADCSQTCNQRGHWNTAFHPGVKLLMLCILCVCVCRGSWWLEANGGRKAFKPSHGYRLSHVLQPSSDFVSNNKGHICVPGFPGWGLC